MDQIKPPTNRIESLDLLKGLVIVIMALDHTRDYFHNDSFLFDPTDPTKTDNFLFFTRWITHFCAPAFSFLAGVSAFLAGRRKSKKELSTFLLTRGFWLIFIEFTIINFGWSFNIHFESIGFLVLWSLGVSMLFLSLIIHLKQIHILIFSLLVIFGHNVLDYLQTEDNFLFSILHKTGQYSLINGTNIRVVYPVIPWIGVMSLGYYFGSFYDKTYNAQKRQSVFKIIGISAIALFVLIRMFNQYGNPKPWESYDTLIQTIYSFLDPSKYPPSLSYILMTLGPTFLFLGTTEDLRGKTVRFLSVFGKVPFFFYILHIYAIHIFALLFAQLSGIGWKSMILVGFVSNNNQLIGYGANLWWVYIMWIFIIVLLYPQCKKFTIYKSQHKEKKWLSYF